MAHPAAGDYPTAHLTDLLAQSVEQQVAEQRALQTALAQVAAVLPRLADLDPHRLHAAVRQAVQDSIGEAVERAVRDVLGAVVAAEVRSALGGLAGDVAAAAGAGVQAHGEQLADLAESAADLAADTEETLERVAALTREVEALRGDLVDGLAAVRATAEGVRVDLAESAEGTRSTLHELFDRDTGAGPGEAVAVWDEIRDGLAGVRTDLDQLPVATATAVGGRLAEPLEALRPPADGGAALTAELAAVRDELAALGDLVAGAGGLTEVEARLRGHLDDAVVQLAATLLGLDQVPATSLPPTSPPPTRPSPAPEPADPGPVFAGGFTDEGVPLGGFPGYPPDEPVADVPPRVAPLMPYLDDESPYLDDDFSWQPTPPEQAPEPAVDEGVEEGTAPTPVSGHDVDAAGDLPLADTGPAAEDFLDGDTGEHRRRWWRRSGGEAGSEPGSEPGEGDGDPAGPA